MVVHNCGYHFVLEITIKLAKMIAWILYFITKSIPFRFLWIVVENCDATLHPQVVPWVAILTLASTAQVKVLANRAFKTRAFDRLLPTSVAASAPKHQCASQQGLSQKGAGPTLQPLTFVIGTLMVHQ